MLRSASISHYKSLAEVNLIFGASNIIVGANGSGKSNLIDCLNFIKEATEDDLDLATTKRHGVESIRQWSKSRPYNITIDLQFGHEQSTGSYKLVLASARGSFKVVEEVGTWLGHGVRLLNETLTYACFRRNEDGEVLFFTDIEDESFLKYIPKVNIPQYDLYLSQISGKITSIYTLMFGSLLNELTSVATYAIYPNTIRQPQIVSKDERLAPDGSNLAAILKRLNSGIKYNKDRLIDSLKIVLPIVSDMQVKSTGGYYVPTARVIEPTGEGHDLNMSQLSDGTLRILGLLAAFYQPNAPNKVSLEEPEQMIHPGLLPVLRDAAADYLAMGSNRQFFMTTHSPQFIDLFEPEAIIWLNFRNGVSEAGKISQRQLGVIRDQLFSAGELLVTEGIGA